VLIIIFSEDQSLVLSPPFSIFILQSALKHNEYHHKGVPLMCFGDPPRVDVFFYEMTGLSQPNPMTFFSKRMPGLCSRAMHMAFY
jgi:hypothetical protein